MNLVRRNLGANLVSNGYMSVVILLCTPCYMSVLGMESWGLVGFYLILIAVISQFGVGLNVTMNRELSHLSALSGTGRQMRDTVRSLEAVYWSLTLVAGLVVVLGAPLIGHYWVQAKTLSVGEVTQVVMLMGLSLAFQMPGLLYSGGLLGLQRQTLLAGINVVMNSLRFFGAVAVLWWISPTIQAFFLWQIGVGAVFTAVLCWCLWRSLPAAEGRASVRRDVLVPLWPFILGTTGLSLAALGLSNLDKVLLSHLLNLETYGYYMLAYMAAVGINTISGSVVPVFMPQLTQRVALNEREQLVEQYHLGSQVLAVLLLTAAVVGAVFSRELLLIWTNDPVKAEKAHLILSLLLAGNALNCLASLPYVLQLANSCSRITLIMNLGALVVMVPLIVVLTTTFGPVGAAAAWVALNLLYLLVCVGVTHRRFLPGQSARWYGHGLLAPLLAATGVATAAWWLIPAGLGRWPLLGTLAAVSVVCLSATALAAPAVRRALSLYLKGPSAARDAARH